MRPRRVALALVAILVAVAVVLGAVSGSLAGAAGRGLEATGLWRANGAATIPPGLFDDPATSAGGPSIPAPGPALPSPVLAPAAAAVPPPRAAAVGKLLRGVRVPGATGTSGGAVVDAASGDLLYARGADTPLTPASTLKLLTTSAALAALGPEHRFTTSVVRGRPGQVVLVGGGDPYLATRADARAPGRATVADLAARTAAELERTQPRTRTVALGYDTSLFSGPAWHPRWPRAYRDVVTPVSPLWVEEGRVGHLVGPRVADPPRAAAQAFAEALRERGVRVTAVEPFRAPAGAERVAAVQSEPLEQIVQQVLMVSDNDGAEVLLRHLGLAAGRPGSFRGGAAALRAQLTALGVAGSGTRVVDGSGLTRHNRVSAATLVGLLRLASGPDHPELRAVVRGLPVAGVEGSLAIRFTDERSRAGRGVVRGKTGTLSEVHSLAGMVRDRDGSLLLYAFVINDPEDGYASTVWLDRATTALSTCGCR